MHSFLPRHELVVIEGASRTGWGAQISTGEKCSVFTRRRQKLSEPKTPASRRRIALPAFVVRALAAEREAQSARPRNIDGLVFTSPRGTPLDARNVSRAFDRDRKEASLPPMTIHDLRRTAPSLMLSQGLSLDDIKRVLGHSSIAMTSDVYGHLVEGRSREIADSMDRALGADSYIACCIGDWKTAIPSTVVPFLLRVVAPKVTGSSPVGHPNFPRTKPRDRPAVPGTWRHVVLAD